LRKKKGEKAKKAEILWKIKNVRENQIGNRRVGEREREKGRKKN
jgi:hypothetical protein